MEVRVGREEENGGEVVLPVHRSVSVLFRKSQSDKDERMASWGEHLDTFHQPLGRPFDAVIIPTPCERKTDPQIGWK